MSRSVLLGVGSTVMAALSLILATVALVRSSGAHDIRAQQPQGASLEDVARLEASIDSLRKMEEARLAKSHRREDEGVVVETGKEEVVELVDDALESREEDSVNAHLDAALRASESAVEELSDDLDLSESQENRANVALASATEELSSLIREGQKGARPWAEVRRDMKNARKNAEVELREVLSEDQLVALAELCVKHGTLVGFPELLKAQKGTVGLSLAGD